MVNKKYIAIALLPIALIGIASAVFLTQNRQETRSRASASTVLFLRPVGYIPPTTAPTVYPTIAPTVNPTLEPTANPTAEPTMEPTLYPTTAPTLYPTVEPTVSETVLGTTLLSKNTGDTVAFDVMVAPGNNQVSAIKLDLQYNPAFFKKGTTTFTPNTEAFPKTIEGPVITDGRVLVSLSIGSDYTKAIQQETKVGTITLIAKSATPSAGIMFGSTTEVRSIAAADEAGENVLASTQPGYVEIIGPDIPTTLSFTTYLHGIGNSGDNANPAASTFSNKNPVHKTRTVDVVIYNSQNNIASTNSGTITYSQADGAFKGSVDIYDAIPQGFYTIKVKEASHLRRLLNGIITLYPQQENKLQSITLVAGDSNNDNKLNMLDYNLLLNCYSDLAPAISCNDTQKFTTDLNDDGGVNQFDYNLFLREVTVQNGN